MRTPQQAFKDAQKSGAIDAWLEGEEIQWANVGDPSHWEANVLQWPNWSLPNLLWRPKPLTFPYPPEGEKWHNPDNLTPDQLGEGYRLLLESEISNNRDYGSFIHKWNEYMWDTSQWLGSSLQSTYRVPAETPFHWDKRKLVRVPLGPEDVPLGSMIREVNKGDCRVWFIVTSCSETGLRTWSVFSGDQNETTWEAAVLYGQILRPGRDPVTGWEPCWKEVEEKGE